VWCSAGVRRIHDAVSVDPINFESGYPKLP
jgi:hypothetical protein